MKFLLSALLFGSVVVVSLGVPQAAPPKSPVPAVTFQADPAGFRGDSAGLTVRVIVPKGWHIQSDAPLDEFLIPTELKASGEGLRFGKPAFPEPLLKDFPALGGRVALFEDTVEARVPVYRKGAQKDPKGAATAVADAVVTLRYQACNDSQCLPPREVAAKYIK